MKNTKYLLLFMIVFGTLVGVTSTSVSAWTEPQPHSYTDVNIGKYRRHQTIYDGVYHSVIHTSSHLKTDYEVIAAHYAYKETIYGAAIKVLLLGIKLPVGCKIAKATTAIYSSSSLKTYTVSLSGRGYSPFTVNVVKNGRVIKNNALPKDFWVRNNLDDDENPNIHLGGYIDSTNTYGSVSSKITVNVKSIDIYSVYFLGKGWRSVKTTNEYTISGTCYGY